MRIAIGSSLVLLALVPFTRDITETLRSHHWLRAAITTFLITLLIWGAWTWRFRWRKLSLFKRCLFLVVSSTYGWIIFRVGVMPEERMHFIQVSALSGLYWNVLKERITPHYAPWIAATLAACLGILEEVIQRWVPGRVFDMRDILMILAGAAFSGLLLSLLVDESYNENPL